MAAGIARLRKLASRVRLAIKYQRLARARRSAIDEDTVLYESFAGNGMLCNPEAIFRTLLAAPDMAHLKHVWALTDLDAYRRTVAEFADHRRVKFVKIDSPAYYAALATAKYLVNNATFPAQFGKRDGQVYLNTWHGTPLKAMGYDIPGDALNTRNIVRNLVSADYLLAPNAATADMYLSAYRMRNIFRGAMIAEGTPRIDRQFAGQQQTDIRSVLRDHGVHIEDHQQVLLYAPTWKGDFYAPTNDVRQMRGRIEALRAQIDTSKYRLLLKLHQQVHKYASIDDELRQILVPNEIPANDILAISDAVITDYSSIFIDFLTTGRPVLFYAPDLSDYQESRGVNLPTAEWPGPISVDIAQLAGHVNRLNTGADDDPAVMYKDAYAAARERYTPREDGHAAERVVDIVFRGKWDGYDVRTDFSDGRTSVLVHLGGMLNNGITSAALCLLDNIDYTRYDVSATFVFGRAPDRERQMRLINPNVRLFPRVGGMNGSKLAVYSLVRVKRRSARQHRQSLARHRRLLHEEWVRCFGASRFDHVVDFSGYSPYWVKLLASRDAGSLSIWLHNDIQAEVANPGRTSTLRANLRGVMALYHQADHLVSVSEPLAEVNRTKLADAAPADKFTYARNTINHERVRHLAYGLTRRDLAAASTAADAATAGDAHELFDAADLRGGVAKLIEHHGIGYVQDEVERRATLDEILPPQHGVRTFVTAGRLSPEKNHERLLRAFDRIHQEDSETRLVILGAGPLENRLAELVDQLGLTAAVKFTGFQPNPYAVVANSDCFVLSSDYEGQPMVLLEALVLGVPAVTTDFDSVKGALPPGYGLIVPRTVAGLADGLRAFLRGEVPAKPFDYFAYNVDATTEFYRAIGAG